MLKTSNSAWTPTVLLKTIYYTCRCYEFDAGFIFYFSFTFWQFTSAQLFSSSSQTWQHNNICTIQMSNRVFLLLQHQWDNLKSWQIYSWQISTKNKNSEYFHAKNTCYICVIHFEFWQKRRDTFSFLLKISLKTILAHDTHVIVKVDIFFWNSWSAIHNVPI